MDEVETLHYLNMAKDIGTSVVQSNSDEDDNLQSTGSSDDKVPTSDDPQVLVSTMDQWFILYNSSK